MDVSGAELAKGDGGIGCMTSSVLHEERRMKGRRGIVSAWIVLMMFIGGSVGAEEYRVNLPPYPGSREHVGFWAGAPQQVAFFNAQSLVKTLVFAEHAAEAPEPLVEFAEPKSYYLLTGRTDVRSKETSPPVKVLKMDPGDDPVVWKIGQLPIGWYMLRIIGAIPAADQETPPRNPPKHLVFSLKVNDRPDGTQSWYVLRGRGVDSFYCVQEFGIHVDDDRQIVAELQLLPESDTSLYCYNLELHDILAGCAKQAGKTAPSYFTLHEREVARREWATSTDPKAKELQAILKAESGRRYTPEQRRARDQEIWDSVPGINTLIEENFLSLKSGWEIAGLKPDYVGTSGDPKKVWGLNRRHAGRYFTEWDRRFCLALDAPWEHGRRPYRPEELYTLEDFRAHKPLGDTGDRGWGVKIGNRLVCPLARATRVAWEAAARNLIGHPEGPVERVARYHLGGDETYARDMALLLCRFAYDLPMFSLYHTVGFAATKDEVPWMARRYYQWILLNHAFADTYDRLFPFIQGNQELASAVGRFVKWVKTPDDLVKLLDTCLVQYLVKNVLTHRYEYANDNVDILLNLVNVQANARISEPWLEEMFTKGVVFQLLGRQPLPLALSTATKRDGTTEIGSVSYTGDGGPALDAAKAIDIYMRHGGLAKYDLRDVNRFPESVAGCYWPLEGPVAGLYHLGIGDVGGPSLPYGRGTNPAANAVEGWRWTRDPKFAWLLANVKGRRYETDEQWAEIVQAATGQPDPIMGKRSRVLPDWSATLESGVGAPDFRFHSAASVRVGWGTGHNHHDALDLRVWAHGLIMSGDYGQRPGYGRPDHAATICHNVVQVDEQPNWSPSWVRVLADMPGVQYVHAAAVPVAFAGALRRQTALIDVDGGRPSNQAKPWLDPNVVTPNVYVFDVFRAKGGAMHTFCFHGCVDDLNFEVNIPPDERTVFPRDNTPERAALEKADAEANYLRDFRWTRADYTDAEGKKVSYMGDEFRPNDADWAATCRSDVLQATWRLARKAEEQMIGGVNKDKGIGGVPTAPRKFTRLHLFNAREARVLHGIVIERTGLAIMPINPEHPHYAGRQIMVRRPGGESVFVSVVEPFAGESFIKDRRALEVEPAGAGIGRPVAVELKVALRADGRPAGERMDVLFADDSGRECAVPEAGIVVQGEFATVQKVGGHVVKATLVKGTRLKAGDLEIMPALAQYRAKIVKIDYRTREVTLDQAVPAAVFRGAFVEIGDDLRRSNHEIADVAERGGVSVLKIRKSLECKRARTNDFTPAGNDTRVKVGIADFAEDGLWVSNGDYSRLWRMRGQFRAKEFTLVGQATAADFAGDKADLITLEIGPGQEVVLASQVAVTRTAAGAYVVHANVPVKVKLPGRAAENYGPTRPHWERRDGA